MKFNDVSFPHPVLGIGDSIKGKFKFNPDITSTTDTYTISIFCEHDNNDLISLIKSNQAEFYCEVYCSNTLYRKTVTSGSNQIKFEIPKKNVKGKVSFTCALIAKSPIQNYQNKMAHPDYDGYSFDIDHGDVLAFFGEFNFNADINYEKLKAVSSFMEVVENRDETAVYTNIDLNKSKIEVQLPTEDYNLFAKDSISKEPKFAPIFHSSIVFNALLIALYNFESYKHLLWAKVIDYRLENEKLFENISIEDKVNIPEIAQRLLGNPFRRVISKLQDIFESSNQNTED